MSNNETWREKYFALFDKLDRVREHAINGVCYPIPMFNGDLDGIMKYVEEEDVWYEELLNLLDVGFEER